MYIQIEEILKKHIINLVNYNDKFIKKIKNLKKKYNKFDMKYNRN